MIRLFIYCIVALAVGGGLALLFAGDPGYVLVNFRGTSIEATLAAVIFGLLLLVLAVGAVSALVRLLNPFHWLRAGWPRRPPAKSTGKGLQLLLLGRWQEAYKVLVENAGRVEIPEVNYVLAALAAFQRGDATSWHWCLDQAERAAPGSDPGIKSFRALLEARAGHPDNSLPILLALLKSEPGSPFVLQQIKDIYVTQQRWDELAPLVPELQKHHVIAPDELNNLSSKTYARRLDDAARSGVDSLRLAWHDLPKAQKHDDALIELYVRRLLDLGQDTEAGALLTSHLKKHWNDALVALYGCVLLRNPQEALALMEGWLKQHPENPVLLLTLGRLSMRNQLWGKAREYFELGLRSATAPDLVAVLNAELARLLENLGEHERSLACYQNALGLKHPLPDVPLPAKRLPAA